MWLLLAFWAFASAFTCAFVAGNKHLDAAAWFLAGFLFGVLAAATTSPRPTVCRNSCGTADLAQGHCAYGRRGAGHHRQHRPALQPAGAVPHAQSSRRRLPVAAASLAGRAAAPVSGPGARTTSRPLRVPGGRRSTRTRSRVPCSPRSTGSRPACVTPVDPLARRSTLRQDGGRQIYR